MPESLQELEADPHPGATFWVPIGPSTRCTSGGSATQWVAAPRRAAVQPLRAPRAPPTASSVPVRIGSRFSLAAVPRAVCLALAFAALRTSRRFIVSPPRRRRPPCDLAWPRPRHPRDALLHAPRRQPARAARCSLPWRRACATARPGPVSRWTAPLFSPPWPLSLSSPRRTSSPAARARGGASPLRGAWPPLCAGPPPAPRRSLRPPLRDFGRPPHGEA